MTKQEFLTALRAKLSMLANAEREDRLNFYAEMIDDRMDEGLSEDQAVASIGTVDEVVSQITTETPIASVTSCSAEGDCNHNENRNGKQKRKLTGREIVLLIVGFPIWLPVLALVFVMAVTLGITVYALFIPLWAVAVSLWSAFGAVVGCAVGGVLGGIFFICTGHAVTGLAVLGVAFVCAGLCAPLFWGSKAVTKGLAVLTKKATVALWREVKRRAKQ